MQCAAYLLSWTTSPLCPLASRVVARGNKPADIVISPRNSDAEYYYVYIHTIHIMSIDMVIENSKLMLLLHPIGRPGEDEKKRASPEYENENGHADASWRTDAAKVAAGSSIGGRA